jgi:hypothetical protein
MRILYNRVVIAVVIAAAWLSLGNQQPSTQLLLASATDRDGNTILDLSPEDFLIEEGGRRCEAVDVKPASYPVAIVVDTSGFARDPLMSMRRALHVFVGSLSGRPVAFYTSGAPPARLVDFTTDVTRLDQAVDHLFASRTSGARPYDAVTMAADDLKTLNASVTMIVVLSSGGPDNSAVGPRAMQDAVNRARAVVNVVDFRTVRASSGLSHQGRPASIVSEDLYLSALAQATRGTYDRISQEGGYQVGLERIRHLLEAEVVVEYAPAPDAPSHELKVGVRLPGVTIRALGLDSR